MTLHAIFLLLACGYSCWGWNVDVSGRFPYPQEQQFRPVAINKAQCYGLARRIRQLKINVPVIYNTRTGEISPVPKMLHTADDNVISRLEREGWEVRRKSVYVPRMLYERVPVCCPWEPNCYYGRQAVPHHSVETTGPCANGGQLIYRDGLQRCECAPGYQGIWCQHSDTEGENPTHISFPSGPLIRVMSPPSPYNNLGKEAELWRRKQNPQLQTSPVMTPGDSRFNAMANPWAYRNAIMLQQQAMRAKMAQRGDESRQVQGVPYNQAPPQRISPVDTRRAMNVRGGNPYSVIDSRRDNSYTTPKETKQNPYSVTSSQGQLPPNIVRGLYALQQDLMQKQAVNPYSRLSQEVPNPHPFTGRTRNEQGDVSSHYRRPQGVDMPQARTPWDLDPFGQQQNPSYMNYPGMPMVPNRNKQAIALVLYQQMMNKQKEKLSKANNAVNSPLKNVSTLLVAGVSLPTTSESPVSSSQDVNAQPQQNTDINTNTFTQEQPDGLQSSILGKPPAPLTEPSGQQQIPASENMKEVEQCQRILTPNLSGCLRDYGLTMEQFMNPEFMKKARAVCEASQPIGQCIMQYDKACGEGEATIITTRKMINSVLQMMGMVCQQIAARGEIPTSPVQGDGNVPLPPGRDLSNMVSQPLPANLPVSLNNPVSATNEVQEPVMNKEEVQKQESSMLHTQPALSSKFGSSQDIAGVTEASVMMGSMGHDSANPVSQELKLFGYPLWLVITLGLALFVAMILAIALICVCCRRRCCRKSRKANKEIEKIPVPLDGKMCTLDIPPPSYNTTVIQKNEDGLSLPPLDLGDGSDDDNDSINEKPKFDEDSGDENDAKEAEGKKE